VKDASMNGAKLRRKQHTDLSYNAQKPSRLYAQTPPYNHYFVHYILRENQPVFIIYLRIV
jgi:hypothetical protein